MNVFKSVVIFFFSLLIVQLGETQAFNPFQKIEDTVKNPGKTIKNVVKAPINTVKNVEQTAVGTVKNVKNIPDCLKDGLKIGQSVLTIVSKKWPANFCDPIQDFTNKGCWAVESVLEKIGPQAQEVKKIRQFLTGTACGCVTKVGTVVTDIKQGQFTKQTCNDLKTAQGCCQKVLNFEPFKKLCQLEMKTIANGVDKVCKKVAGTCPALVASAGVLTAEIVATVAAMVAATEVGPEEYVIGVLNVLSDLHLICGDIIDANKKNCCRIAPVPECKKVMGLGSTVCTQLDCPFQIAGLIQAPTCDGLQALMKSPCCQRMQQMPKPFGQLFGKLCTIAKSTVSKTLGSACRVLN